MALDRATAAPVVAFPNCTSTACAAAIAAAIAEDVSATTAISPSNVAADALEPRMVRGCLPSHLWSDICEV